MLPPASWSNRCTLRRSSLDQAPGRFRLRAPSGEPQMPLQNRVTPEGEVIATAHRGLMMGNRGGLFHLPDQTLGARRWATRQWIACVLDFKGRRREVMQEGYTELFFLDEATALAAGHRPCFECRRRDAQSFAEKWAQAKSGGIPKAPEMDVVLQNERLDGRAKRTHAMPFDELSDGAFVAFDDAAYALRGDKLLRWSPSG